MVWGGDPEKIHRSNCSATALEAVSARYENSVMLPCWPDPPFDLDPRQT
jgi:hypothetical protein